MWERQSEAGLSWGPRVSYRQDVGQACGRQACLGLGNLLSRQLTRRGLAGGRKLRSSPPEPRHAAERLLDMTTDFAQIK